MNRKSIRIMMAVLTFCFSFSSFKVHASEIYNENSNVTNLILNESNNYIKNSTFPISVVKMKIGNDYIALNKDNTLITTKDESKAAIFEIYEFNNIQGEYRYLKNDDPSDNNSDTYGDTRKNFVIKCKDNGKYLTIQNYDYEQKDEKEPYFNVLKNDDSENIANYYKIHTFGIKATADEAAWNERFYIDSLKDGGFMISTHQKSLREPNHIQEKTAWWQDEDKGFYKTPLTIEENNILGADIDNTLYEDFGFNHNNTDETEIDYSKFTFEKVNNSDDLYIHQFIDDNKVTLTWNIVDGDRTVSNYSISEAHSPIKIEDNRMNATISLDEKDVVPVTITYSNGEKKLSSIKEVKKFNHPGLLMSQEDLDTMKKHVENKEEPWYSDYLLMESNDNASLEIKAPEALVGVGRGGPEGNGNIKKIEQASDIANLAALQWVITGDDKYAEKATCIINDWAKTLKHIDGRDRILGASLNIYKFNQVVEILRYYNGGYSGFTSEDFNNYKKFLINVVYPVIQDLGTPMLANGSWDTIAGHMMISMSVVLDDYDMFKRAVNFYKSPYMNGSIENYINENGQPQEIGRDQGHLQLALAHMVDICEIAYNQGVDLYSLEKNRLLKGLEMTAKHNLFENVDFEPMNNIYLRNDPVNDPFAYWTKLDASVIKRGVFGTAYEVALSHYRKVGISSPWIEKVVYATQPQGSNYEENTYGTLAFYNGPVMDNAPIQYFKFRTKLSPYYQTSWDKYGSSETYNSYLNVMNDGTIKIDAKYENAQYYELIRNDDKTYSIKNIKTNKYLSVTDDKTQEGNFIVKADSSIIGDNEKFIKNKNDEFKSINDNTMYLGLEKTSEQGNNPEYNVLQLVLSKNAADSKSFVLMYNREEKAENDYK